MNLFAAFVDQQVWHIAGWTMLHFLWLGTLVGIVAIALRALLRRAAANVRYFAALACLFVLAALPIAIAACLATATTSPLASAARPNPLPTSATTPAPTIDLADNPPTAFPATATAPSPAPPTDYAPSAIPSTTTTPPSFSTAPSAADPLAVAVTAVQSVVPYLPWLWIIGTPITFALLAAGLIGTKRLRRASRVTDDRRILDVLSRLSSSLRIGKRVTIAICDRIAAPVLIGIVRPIILLPPAALTGWSPDEIEMVLLHELAHVRRWDNLVNLIQRLIESLLFFHPAVWLVSTWVRREREQCCDALVVRRTQRPHAYAELLVNLASQKRGRESFSAAEKDSRPLFLGTAMSAGPLRSRIRRILQLEDDPMLISGKSLALTLAALLVAATLAVLYLPTIGQAEESTLKTRELTTENTEATEKQNQPVNSEAENATTDDLADVEPIGSVDVGRVQIGDESVTVVRGRKDAVEAVVKPAEADDWPAGVTFPSPKDREIALRAWKELELKTVPASDAELALVHPHGWRGGLKLVDFDNNFPHLEGPFILTEISSKQLSKGIVDLGNLEQVLNAIASEKGDEKIFLKGAHSKGSFEWVMRRPEGAPAVEFKAHPRFPTLEEQKLADQVWKQLGLEMEPIGDDDLQRVKALGFDGGLKVTAASVKLTPEQMMQQQVGRTYDSIQTDDILVGLHVWPTSSMKDVVAILNRDDLLELNPLKFYVVRQTWAHDDKGSRPLDDVVVTGRVNVKLPTKATTQGVSTAPGLPPRSRPYESSAVREADPNRPQPASSADDLFAEPTPGNQPYDTPHQPSLPLIMGKSHEDTLRELAARGYTLYLMIFYSSDERDANAKYTQQFKELSSHDLRNVAVSLVDVKNVSNTAKQLDVKRIPTYVLFNKGKEAARIAGPQTVEQLLQLIGKVQSADSQPAEPQAAAKSALRYDGKSFDEWRDLWQNELSAAKRAEAVRALAAFARAGYGKQATGVILDVAGNYDFLIISQDAEGKLKQAVIDELTPDYPRSDLAKFWLPDLVARFEKDPDKWKHLANHTLYQLRTDDPETIALLRSLAQNGPAEVRTKVMTALVGSTKSHNPDNTASLDENTRQLLAEALRGDDPARMQQTLWLLLDNPSVAGGMGGGFAGSLPKPKLIFLPELVPLLFQGDEPNRQHVRNVLQYITDKDAPQVVEQLVAVLKDEARKNDHLHAIRALAAMGKHSQAASSELANILKQSDDKQILAAALVAVTRISGEPTRISKEGTGTTFNADSLSKAVDKLLSPADRVVVIVQHRIGKADKEQRDRLDQEDKAIFPPTNPQHLGGGGFF